MRLTGVKEGDIVDVNKKGRRFFARITHVTTRVFTIKPLDRNVTYFTATSHEIVGLYRKAKGSA